MRNNKLCRILKQRLVYNCVIQVCLRCEIKLVSSGAHALESVLGLIVFKLSAKQERMSSEVKGKFICCHQSRNITKVTVREGFVTQYGINVSSHHQVSRREVTAIHRTRFILTGVRNTQGIVQLTIQESGIKFTGDRGMILLLIVTGILENLSIGRVALMRRKTCIAKTCGRSGRIGNILTANHGVAQVESVIATDIPIQTSQNLEGRDGSAVVDVGARIVAPVLAHVIAESIHHQITGAHDTILAIGECLAGDIRQLAVLKRAL